MIKYNYIVKTRRWLDDVEFKDVLTIADYVGREGGYSKFLLNPSKILRNGLTFDDVVDVLEKYDFEYNEDLIRRLSETLTNVNEVIVELSPDGKSIIMKATTYLGSIYESLREFIKYDKVSKVFKIMPYAYFRVVKELTSLGFKVVDKTGFNLTQPLPIRAEFKGVLRDYQKEALERWLSNNSQGIIALPTGSGKTVIGVAAISKLNERTIIVAYTKEQLLQWRDAIVKFTNIPQSIIGMYYSEEKRIAPITLTTYQTAYKYIHELKPYFTFLLIDEVHHLPAEKFKHIAVNSIAPYRMGLSATPYREDGRHVMLFPLMGGVIYYKSPAELAEGGYLAPYRVVTIYVRLTPEERRKYLELLKKYRELVGSSRFEDVLEAAKKGNKAALEALKIHNSIRSLVQKSRSKIEKVKELVEEELSKGNKIIVFAHYVDLAEEIAKNVGAFLLTGDMDREKRENILNRFKHMRSGVLVVTTVGDEGLDIPDASVGVLVAGTGSKRQFIQRLGRLLRPKEGKEAVLYEIVVRGTSEEVQSRKRKSLDLDVDELSVK